MAKTLILHNDNVSEFMDVVHNVSNICEMDAIDSEVIVLKAHCQGSCPLMSGDCEELFNMQTLFEEKGILTTIE
jgi:hypothetical protein